MTGVFRTSEERVTIVEEQTVYTFDELIADIGGGLGTVLESVSKFFWKTENSWKYRIFKTIKA